ncbi:hypothetical protein BC831DRAFT_55855 [Entophlyctis helioformis]|nr:hypothetical protein BC831DRAFT_55855 [Entophlyctis helioformis]
MLLWILVLQATMQSHISKSRGFGRSTLRELLTSCPSCPSVVAMADHLPWELRHEILKWLPIHTLWRLRRLSTNWKNSAESAFARQLLESGKLGMPIIVLELYLLNGRGGPWFSMSSPNSIEDSVRIKLRCRSVDIANKTVDLAASPSPSPSASASASAPTALLLRRPHLDRLQWCLKGRFRWHSREQEVPSRHGDFPDPDRPSALSVLGPTFDAVAALLDASWPPSQLQQLQSQPSIFPTPTSAASSSRSSSSSDRSFAEFASINDAALTTFTLVSPDTELFQPAIHQSTAPQASPSLPAAIDSDSAYATDDSIPQGQGSAVQDSSASASASDLSAASSDHQSVLARRARLPRSHSPTTGHASTLSTFEMTMRFFTVDHGNVTDANGITIARLEFMLKSLRVSYSYLFALLDAALPPRQPTTPSRTAPTNTLLTQSGLTSEAITPSTPRHSRSLTGLPSAFHSTPSAQLLVPSHPSSPPSVFYGGYSVYPSEKVAAIVSAATQAGLTWSSTYWSFDLVLHWLMHGMQEDVQDIVEYLAEHEAFVGRSTGKSPRQRRVRRYLVTPE